MNAPTQARALARGAAQSRARRDDGAAVIEFAIVLPLIVLLIFGGTFVARAAITYSTLADLSGRTARYATRVSYDASAPTYALRPSAADVVTYARRAAGSNIDVTVSPDPANAHPGDLITVTLTARKDLGVIAGAANAIADVMHIGHPFGDKGLSISSTTTMREE
jgi:Flp pilus assembly protein TadG